MSQNIYNCSGEFNIFLIINQYHLKKKKKKKNDIGNRIRMYLKFLLSQERSKEAIINERLFEDTCFSLLSF